MSSKDETCKNCKSWKRRHYLIKWDLEDLSKAYWEEFSCFDERTDLGGCNNDYLVYSHRVRIPSNGLGYSDAECYEANILTGEDFGCIHFEKREGL